MAAELPYLKTYKNVGVLFDKIASAKAPDVFTTRYLGETLGLKSTGDRQLISLLRSLGFLDGGNKPTPEYAQLKNPAVAAQAIGAGIRRAYAPLFESNESANELPSPELKGLISQLSGADTNVVAKILGTLQAIMRKASFADLAPDNSPPAGGGQGEEPLPSGDPALHGLPPIKGVGLRPEFHYNIQVHLPSSGTEETYLHIFNALRRSFTK